MQSIAAGFGVPVDAIHELSLGLNCNPITVLGVGGKTGCEQNTVCCENNNNVSLIHSFYVETVDICLTGKVGSVVNLSCSPIQL